MSVRTRICINCLTFSTMIPNIRCNAENWTMILHRSIHA